MNWLLECCGLLCCRMHHCLSVSFLLQIAVSEESNGNWHPLVRQTCLLDPVLVCCTQRQFVPIGVEALCSVFMVFLSYFPFFNINYAFGSSCYVKKCLFCF